MPELPEVEAVARTLRPLVTGQRIVCCRVLPPIAVRPQSAATLCRNLSGRRIRAVERRGKYLLLQLDRGCVTLYFRLDGQLLWFRNSAELDAKSNEARNGVHVDVALVLSNGVLGLVDRRHFGRVNYWAGEGDCPGLAALRIDALSPEFSAERFARLLANSSQPVKEFLLNQARVAGIGNIYSSEALWHARIHPRRRARHLRPAEALRLHKAIVSVLRRALECCLDPKPDFRDPSWWFQGLEKILRAYGREGKPCHRCGVPIRRMQQNLRSTYFCGRCQK